MSPALPLGTVPADAGAVSAGAAAALRAAGAAGSIAAHLDVLAGGLEAAAAAFPGHRIAGWDGLAAAAVGALLATQPRALADAARACRTAGTALAGHAAALATVAQLRRESEAAPGELAAALRARADALADESARRTAATLAGLARAAPQRRGRLLRAAAKLREWQAEAALGGLESTEALAATAALVQARAQNRFDPRSGQELRAAAAGLVDSARHPGALLAGATDWETWRSNPARAAGHLGPDAAAAALGGGTARRAWRATMVRRGRAAMAAATDRAGRRTARAVAAQDRLVARALDRALAARGTQAWRGPGGTRLSAADAAQVRTFRELSQAGEQSLTETVRLASRQGDGELAGLGHVRKAEASLLRKVATELGNTGRPLPALLREINDAVRYTVLLRDRSYVSGAREIARQLEREGFHPLPARNGWADRRAYRGLNTHWVDPRSGASFEVQFHTPRSWRAGERTHGWYDEKRLPDTPKGRRDELDAQIRAEYEKAPVPEGAEQLDVDPFPPITPDPFAPPTDYAVIAAVAGAAASQAPEAARHSRTP